MGFNRTIVPKNGTSQLPWANEYVAANPKKVGNVWDVTNVKLKEKGVIIEVVDWCAWLFKSSTAYRELIPYLEQWVKVGTESPILQLLLEKEVPHFVIGEDDIRTTYWRRDEQGIYYQVSSQLTTRVEDKPIGLTLPTVPSTSVPTAKAVDALADVAANAHRGGTSKEKPLGAPTNGKTPR